MFVDIGNYKNETVKKIVVGYFWHEFTGTEEDLVNQIHEAINEKIEISEKNKDNFWTFVRDYIKADYKTFDEFYDNALLELYSDVRNCFKEVKLTNNELNGFKNKLHDYISDNICAQMMEYFEQKYPDMQIRTSEVSFDEENIIDDSIDKIVKTLETISIENMTRKENK